MSQLRQNQDRLDELDVQVKIVAFDNDFMAKAYVQATGLHWPLLLDCERKLYTAYGMARGSWWAIYNPVSIAKYIWLIIVGQKPGKPGSDWRQLGGDVLIDPEGIIRLHHVSADPHDRPRLREIFEVVSSK